MTIEVLNYTGTVNLDAFDGDEVDPANSDLTVWYDDYSVAFENASRVFAATLWFDIKSVTDSLKFTGKNGFTVLDNTIKDGLYGVRLGYTVAGGRGFTSLAEVDVLSIAGATGVEVVGGQISGYDENGEPDHFFVFGYFEKPFTPVLPNKYDLNGDGKVDQLDLVVALSYFMVSSTHTNWDEAQKADFDESNLVDIPDFMELLGEIAW